MKVLPDAMYIHLYYATRGQGNDLRWVRRSTGLTVRWTWARTPFISWHPRIPTLTRRPGGVCGFMAPMSAQTLSSSCQKIWAFLFPQLIFVLLSSLWEGLEQQLLWFLLLRCKVFPQGDLPPVSGPWSSTLHMYSQVHSLLVSAVNIFARTYSSCGE